MRLEDLPPGKLRDQALAKLGQTTPAPARRRPKVRGLGCTGRYECDLEAG